MIVRCAVPAIGFVLGAVTLRSQHEMFSNDVSAFRGAGGVRLVSPTRPAVPTFTVNSVAVAEGNSGVTYAHTTVTFSAPLKRNGGITYYASSEPPQGTAVAGSDYPTGLFGAPLPAGQTSVDLPIGIYGDQ